MIKEDMPFWDATLEALAIENIVVKASIVVKEKGVIACLNDIAKALRKLDLKIEVFAKDGEEVDADFKIAEIIGDAKKILILERTILNLLMHCSGVATSVKKLIDTVKLCNPRVKIAATRKTLPFLRYFEKKAVAIAGGDTHRLSLSDALIIKDNHVKIIGDIVEAIKIAKQKTSFIHKIEVEVRSIEEALKAVEAGADVVMLDNMSPDDVGKVVEKLKERKLRDKVVIEVSGGIRIDNVCEYAKHDIDVISCSWITLSPKAIDMSIDVDEVIKK